MPVPVYQHTQSSPLHWLLFLVAAALGVAALLVRSQGPVLVGLLLAGAALFALLALSFATLTVTGEADRLRVRFGPLPVFGTRIAYADIASVESARSTFIDGWGIHYIPGRGWIYNLWGYDCVRLVVHGRPIRIGTDDAANLVEFLRSRTAVAARAR